MHALTGSEPARAAFAHQPYFYIVGAGLQHILRDNVVTGEILVLGPPNTIHIGDVRINHRPQVQHSRPSNRIRRQHNRTPQADHTAEPS